MQYTNKQRTFNFQLPIIIMCATLFAACQAPVVNPNSPATSPVIVQPEEPVTTKPSTPVVKKSNVPTPKPPTKKPTKPKTKPPVKPKKPITAKEVIQKQKEARQTRHQHNRQHAKPNPRDGKHIPAFGKLMKIGIKQLRNNELNKAKVTLTKAQRIAPQSPAVYMYLSEIALKQGQGTQAENLARRGLLVSRSKRYDKALWKMVLISAKMRNHEGTLKEAQKQLAKLN